MINVICAACATLGSESIFANPKALICSGVRFDARLGRVCASRRTILFELFSRSMRRLICTMYLFFQNSLIRVTKTNAKAEDGAVDSTTRITGDETPPYYSKAHCLIPPDWIHVPLAIRIGAAYRYQIDQRDPQDK